MDSKSNFRYCGYRLSNSCKQFEKSLHGLRGIAALAVFMAHCAGGYSLHFCQNCGYKPMLDSINNIGTFGVELFFIISGYVIFRACFNTEPSEFFRRRFWRIYPVFFVFTVLFVIANIALQIEPEKNRIDYLLYNLLFINLFLGTPALTPNAWTITFEVIFYFLTFIFVYNREKARSGLVFLFAAVASLWFLYLHPISSYYLAGTALSLVCFYKPNWQKSIDKHVVRVVEISCLSFIVLLAAEDQIYNWQSLIHSPESILLFTLVIIFTACILHKESMIGSVLQMRPFMYLGTVSYSLYLAHPYSYFMSKVVTKKVDGLLNSAALQGVVFLVAVLVSTALMTWLVHHFLEAPLYTKMSGKKIIGKYSLARSLINKKARLH